MQEIKKYVVNGQEYSNLDEVPQEFQQYLRDEDNNGQPDFIDRGFRIARYASIFFIVIGIGLLIGAAVSFQKTHTLIQQGITTEGTVLKLNREIDSEGDVFYYPLISFVTEAGQEIRFESKLGSGSPDYTEGQTVAILYTPEKPTDARINDFQNLYFLPLVLGGLGLFDLIITMIVLFSFRTKKK